MFETILTCIKQLFLEARRYGIITQLLYWVWHYEQLTTILLILLYFGTLAFWKRMVCDWVRKCWYFYIYCNALRKTKYLWIKVADNILVSCTTVCSFQIDPGIVDILVPYWIKITNEDSFSFCFSFVWDLDTPWLV